MDLAKNSSCILILYKKDKILLQLRDNNAPTAKNEWAFFGGGIEKGESPKEAIIR
ncbi:MAG: NUDIX domain-containing protein [Candidatus Woesearchaeota archaeon]